jgi:glycosyltransferase involved in cell wall biosynthesis
MKVKIAFKFVDRPYGGANQFLLGFKKLLEKKNIYTNNLEQGDTLLINLSPDNFYKSFFAFSRCILFNKKIKIIGRIDGPIGLIRSSNFFHDYLFLYFANWFCDGLIFQSDWSKKRLEKLKTLTGCPNTIILNGCDQKLFTIHKQISKRTKLNIVASSWSANPNKGFDVYQWLDENLDYNQYNFFFVGNTLYSFKNATYIPPMSSKQIATFYNDMDIYITASKNDPCSNSLIEAICCGLVPLSLNDGGHPEINQNKYLNFTYKEEILEKLNDIKSNLDKLKTIDTSYLAIEYVTNKYLQFFSQVNLKKRMIFPFRFFLLSGLYSVLVIEKFFKVIHNEVIFKNNYTK